MVSKTQRDLAEFAESTSLHGVANVAATRYPRAVRVVWGGACLFMLAIYLRMLCVSLVDYARYPVITNVQYRRAQSIKFPSVTICNNNFARASEVGEDEQLKFLFKAPGWNPGYELNTSDIDLAEMSTRVAHLASDMYLECAFDGQRQTPCDVEREARWARLPTGYCHTFNAKAVTEEHGDKFTTRAGAGYGLDLLVNVEQYEYLLTTRNSSGLQVVVHDQYAMPDVSEKGFLVSPGTETLVALKKTEVKRLPEPHAKAPHLCEDTQRPGYQNPLKHFHPYSQSACRRECRIAHQMTSCNCSAHFYGGDNVTVCSFVQFSGCALQARAVFDRDPSLLASCNCAPTCHETVFDVSVSSGVMPDPSQREAFVAALNSPFITAANLEKNILVLKVFFDEMRYTLVEEQPRYTPTGLFGELGGLGGLCLGASMLTLLEICQLLVSLAAHCLSRLLQ